MKKIFFAIFAFSMSLLTALHISNNAKASSQLSSTDISDLKPIETDKHGCGCACGPCQGER